MIDNFQDKNVADFLGNDFGASIGTRSTDSSAKASGDHAASDTETSVNREGTNTIVNKVDQQVRKYSRQVKNIISETKSALTLGLDEQDEHNNMTINEEVTVIELAPSVFKAIRTIDGITPNMIEQSLNTDKNSKQLFKAKESEGKSGSFMFQSHDKRFIIKTMNRSEQQVMLKILPSYMSYLLKNKNSLIARIYGIFTVRMED